MHGDEKTPGDKMLKKTLTDAGIKFVRIIWCDNANVIRAKAAHVNYLDDYIKSGVGITMAQQALPVMYDSVVPETGLGHPKQGSRGTDMQKPGRDPGHAN